MNPEIRSLIRDSITFTALSGGVLIGLFLLSWAYTADRDYTNAETEANLPILTSDTQYDVLMLGISHARIFSRHRNHERFEATTGKSMINLSQGGGFGGLDNQLLHLKYFIQKGNSADELILVLSPMLMFNRNPDRTSVAFGREPFDPEFFQFVLQNGVENKHIQLAYYLRSKIYWDWIMTKPFSLDQMDKQIDGLDSAAMKRTMPSAYPYGLDASQFEDRKQVAEAIFKLAKSQNMRISVVLPAALFGKWPGHEQTLQWVQSVQPSYELNIIDLSDKWVMRTDLFYDHHHLNTEGVMKAVEVVIGDQ
jgi:hypothetical protein